MDDSNLGKKFLLIMLAVALVFAVGCSYQIPTSTDETPVEDESSAEDVISEILDEVEEDLDEDITEEEVTELLEEEEETVVVVEEEEEVEEEAEAEELTIPRKIFQEGALVSFPNLKKVDADGDKITYTFTPPLDKNGEWQTEEGDAGEYRVTITATDGVNRVAQDIILLINSSNNPPRMENIADIEVNEGDVVSFNPVVSDEDGDDVTVTYSGWMKTNSYRTKSGDAGEHTVIIRASDGILSSSQEVKVTVSDVNRAPLLGEMEDILAFAGDTVVISPIAADPDGDKLTYEYSGSLFDDNGVWQTKEGDEGSYSVTVTVSDGDAETSGTLNIIVRERNSPPVLDDMDDIVVDEGKTVTLDPRATDPEGDNLKYSFSGWMSSDTYTTDYNDAGTHVVKITVTDKAGNTDSTNVQITVKDVNRPPEIDLGSL